MLFPFLAVITSKDMNFSLMTSQRGKVWDFNYYRSVKVIIVIYVTYKLD